MKLMPSCKIARSLLLLAFCSTAVLTQAETTVPNTFVDGTPAEASEVNENFDALAGAIDEGLGVAGAGHYLPYWFDANGKNLGMFQGGGISLIRVEGFDNVLQSARDWDTYRYGASEFLWWTGPNCSGDSFFDGTSTSARGSVGAGAQGIVIRDISTTNENDVFSSYRSTYNGQFGSIDCFSPGPNYRFEAGTVNPGIQTSIPPGLDAVPPFTIKWSTSGQPPYAIN